MRERESERERKRERERESERESRHHITALTCLFCVEAAPRLAP